ncbi:hypothetical protein MUP79_05705, partial [Candidatus Bathyarchaeota archaeon]|nr:hypothetical protein [Candidatus Bathyarchaeota archaeon]
IEGSTYYKPKNYTTEFNVTITSEFTPSMISPKNQSFIKGVDQFNLSANLSDVDGCGLVGDGNVTFRILGTSYTYQSTGNGAGIYNATITDTNLPEYTYGWYNVTVNASRQYYPNASSVQNYSFYLASRPVLSITGGGVNPMTGGWGKTFNFTVKVYDQDGNNVTVHLWKKPTSASNWEYLGNQTCYPCSTQPANPSTLVFTINNFTCADVNNSEYKFNATDEFGYTSTSEPGGSFVIEKDTVSYTVIAGAGENAIREGDNTTILSVLVQDSDRGYASLGSGYNGSFYVTTDNAAWGPVYNTSTNGSGYINLNFNAACSHLYGPQKWKAGIEGDSCYNQFNIFTGNQTLYVIGQLKNDIVIPTYQQTFNVTQNVTVRLNTTSDCSGEGLINNSYVTVQLKSPSSAWESCSPVNNESSPQGIYNCTWTSTDKQEGNWSLQLNSSRQYFLSNQTYLNNWFWLENLNPTYSSQSVSPAQDGWSRYYNYTILINDSDSDMVNCSLWINKYDGSGWLYKGKSTLYSPSGITNQNCSVIVWDFTGADIGDNTFLFQIEDTESANSYNTTNITGPTLEPSNVTLAFITANSTEVNMTGDTELLIVRVNDTDNSTVNWFPQNVSTTFWVQYNSSFDQGNLTKTNSSGFANITFDPNCSYSVGPRIWFAGTTDNYYDRKNTTSNLTIIIRDSIQTTLQTPNGSVEYLKGTNVTFRFYINDSCNNNITGVTNNLTVFHEETGQPFNCSPIIEEGNGWYNCTINTSSMPAKAYTTMIISNKTYYNPNNLTKVYSASSSSFFIETAPVLSSPVLNTSVLDGDSGENGSWSEARYFSVRVTDDDDDQVTINLYKRKWTGSGWGSWTNVGTAYCNTDCNSTLIYINESGYPTPSYTSPTDLGTWQYNFTAYDASSTPRSGGTSYSTQITPANYTVEKDDMALYYGGTGSNTTVWRNGSDSKSLSIRVFDVDQNRYLSGGEGKAMVWITKDHANLQNVTDPSNPPATDASGYINHSFDPNSNCSYDVGMQYWIIGLSNNQNYKDVNSSIYNLTLWSYLNGTINIPNGEAYPREAGQNVTFNMSVFDECGYGINNANSTNLSLTGPATYIITSGIQNLGSGIYWYNWSTTNPDKTLGTYNTTFEAAKDYYVSLNKTKVNSFTLGTRPQLQLPDPSLILSGDGGWGETFTFRVQCMDTDGNVLNISLWKRKSPSDQWELLDTKACSGTSWNLTSFPISSFDCNDITPPGMNSSYKFNTTDLYNFTATTSEQNFTITKDNVSTTYVSGYSVVINREGSENGTFAIMINDTDRSNAGVGSGIQGIFHITTDGSSYSTYYTNSTSPDSILRYSFEPNCTYTYGPQSWIAGTFNDTCYSSKNHTSQSFTINGTLKNNILTPSFQQIFNVTQNVTVRLNTTSDCSGEGLINNSYVTVQLKSPSSAWESCSPVN